MIAQGSLTPVAPLFVPGDRPERFEKAASSGADAVIVDLEDAVSADRKDIARASFNLDFTTKPVILRVNGFHAPGHGADIAVAMIRRPAALMLPKAQDAQQIGDLHEATGLPMIALIESAAGIANARAIAATKGIVGLAFGSIDYCADLGCAHTRQALMNARSEIVLAARIAGISAPLDGVTTSTRDLSLISDDAHHAAELGFGGKLCIHPAQIAAVLEAFAASPEQISWAERVLSSGDGAQLIDGAMVDEPVRLRAARILSRR